MQNLVTVARSQSELYISGGCLEGQELSLSQQLEKFATEVIQVGISEIVILPLFLLEGVHVSDDIPKQVAIAQSNLQIIFPDLLPNKFIFRTLPHLGTASQIPSLLLLHFEKYTEQ